MMWAGATILGTLMRRKKLIYQINPKNWQNIQGAQIISANILRITVNEEVSITNKYIMEITRWSHLQSLT